LTDGVSAAALRARRKGPLMRDLYPIFLKLKGRQCLVVGGGNIACRKIESLLECGPRVRVVAPDCDHAVWEMWMAGRIELARRMFRPEDLEGVFLAIAATNDEEVNRAIHAAARERGVLCNVVDRPDLCDFYVPAVVERGDLQIAISTNGKAPALGAALRNWLEEEIGPGYGSAVERLGKLRERVRARYPNAPERRMEVLRRVAGSDTLWAALRSRDPKALDAIMESWTSCSLD